MLDRISHSTLASIAQACHLTLQSITQSIRLRCFCPSRYLPSNLPNRGSPNRSRFSFALHGGWPSIQNHYRRLLAIFSESCSSTDSLYPITRMIRGRWILSRIMFRKLERARRRIIGDLGYGGYIWSGKVSLYSDSVDGMGWGRKTFSSEEEE